MQRDIDKTIAQQKKSDLGVILVSQMLETKELSQIVLRDDDLHRFWRCAARALGLRR